MNAHFAPVRSIDQILQLVNARDSSRPLSSYPWYPSPPNALSPLTPPIFFLQPVTPRELSDASISRLLLRRLKRYKLVKVLIDGSRLARATTRGTRWAMTGEIEIALARGTSTLRIKQGNYRLMSCWYPMSRKTKSRSSAQTWPHSGYGSARPRISRRTLHLDQATEISLVCFATKFRSPTSKLEKNWQLL
jgi:hypothetical protein